MNKPLPLDELSDLLEGEDTSFVSIADFFSLLSIAFIYFAVSFGNPLSAPTILQVESVAESGSGPAIQIDETVANVSLLISKEAGLVVRVISPLGSERADLYVQSTSDPMVNVPVWVSLQLQSWKGIKYVVLYLDLEGASLHAYQLRDRIASELSQQYDVRFAFD
jgi:hypothetical protein